MAEVALTSIAKSALTLFSSLAKEELLLLWNSGEELQRLQATIEIIGDLLQDADKMQSTGDAVLSCLSKLRNAMYEADDLFDSLAYELLRKKTMPGGSFTKEVRLFFSNSNQVATIFKVAHQVKSLRGSLDQIKADMDLCGFRIQQSQSGNFVQPVLRGDRFKTHSFVHQEDVIGRDQERDRIVDLLLAGECPEDRKLSVVAVIGFGGLGKTTLAQLVYKDERVKKEFDVCLWACINYLSDLEQVLIEIIASKGVKHHDLGLEKLQEKLREIIGGKKFLLVIDDLWDESYERWSRLDSLLRCGSSGKVLVTTRSVKVAECLDAPESSCVDLKVLSEKSAWCLFEKRAFHVGEASKYPELEALGRKIVSKCGNVPLSVIVVGSLLRHRKREVRTWSDFLDNELGRVLSNTGSNQSIRDVLMVSYRDLHPNLKLCFAYCSLFPKDHRFEMELLVRLWISQGFVNTGEDSTQSLEEQGEAYFFYLVDRCFFQQCTLMPLGYFDYTYSATMHDLIHDVAIDVAKTDIMLIDRDHINRGKRASLRHISMHSAEIDASFGFDKLVSDPNIVRTILFHTSRYQILKISPSSLDMILTSFRMLRTLGCSGSRIESIPNSIGELIHLRYLDLSGCVNLRHLPNSICKIHHLITLNLNRCSRLERMPPKIGQLISLRHLTIEGCEALESLPHGLAGLTSLVDLDRIIVHPESGGLGYLKNLNHLSGIIDVELPQVRWLNAIADAKRSNMSEKHKLRRLSVRWIEKRVGGKKSAHEQMTKDEVEAVLEALEPSQNLEQLNIANYGGVKPPRWLVMIKNLKKLSLVKCEDVEYLEDEMKNSLCFSSIESISISGMKNLKGWWRQEIVQEPQRPCLDQLTSLSICDCPELQGKLPLLEGIEELRLERVDVQWVPELMIANLNKLKEVYLTQIKGLVCLPEEWIRHLTCLERLCLNSCGDLRWMSRRGLAKLTALKHLEITSCECEIRDEDEEDIIEVVEEGMPWKPLQGLSYLEIPVLDVQLVEGLGSMTSLEYLGIGKWLNRDDVVLPSNAALQNLRELDIGFEGDRTCDLRQTGIHNLPSLTYLTIEGCKELYLCWETLLFSMHLTYLTFRNIGSVIGVEPVLQSQLRAPTIGGLQVEGTIKWIHGGVQEVEEEQLLPDLTQHISSLRYLSISGSYEKVRSVPKWLPRLKSLSLLEIRGCSQELKRRCEKENGEDWPLISHISNIFIKSIDELREEESSTQAAADESLNQNSQVEARRKIGWCGLKI